MRNRLVPALLALGVLAGPSAAHFVEHQLYVIDTQNDIAYLVRPTQGWTWQQALQPTASAVNPGAIGFNDHGHMLLANFGDNTLIELDGHGGAITVLTALEGLDGPLGANGVLMGPGHGDIYISNATAQNIMRYEHDFSAGEVFIDASDGLVHAGGMAFLADGDLLVANSGTSGQLLHVKQDGTTSVFATLAGGENPISIVASNNGDVYVLTQQGPLYRIVDHDPNNIVLLGTYGPPNVDGGISFNSDYTVLYHVNAGDGGIREINPITGSSVLRLTLPGNPRGMIYVGTQFQPGTFYSLGSGLAGSGGLAPVLDSHEEPRIGQPAEIHCEDFLGGTQIFMFLGQDDTSVPLFGGKLYIPLGGPTILVDFPSGGTPGVAGDGHVDLQFTMPNLPSLVGVKLYMQALAIDPGAVAGVSMSNGLAMFIGE